MARVRMMAMSEPLSQNRCCVRMEWTPAANLGHAAGLDFDLGRCATCGAYIMAVFYQPSTTYKIIPDTLARHFLSLNADPRELKLALKKWIDT